MFFLIPVFHDQALLRRWPWVSTVLLALTVAASFVAGRAEEAARDRMALAANEAVEFWLEHPGLDGSELLPLLPPALALQLQHVGGDTPSGPAGVLRDLAPGPLALSPAAPPTPEQQARLDGLVAEARAAADDRPFARFGFVAAAPAPGSWLTYAFLHSGIFHLLGNMLLFWLASTAIEDRWGRPATASFYGAAAAVSALGFQWVRPQETSPLVGASGAVAALMGVFLVRFLHARVRFLYAYMITLRPKWGAFYAPAWLVLPLWLAWQVLEWVLVPAGLRSVAVESHVAGFAFGVAVAGLVRLARLEERWLDPGRDRVVSRGARDARPRLRAAEARLEDRPGDLEARAEAAHAALDAGEQRVAARHARTLVVSLIRAGRVDDAVDAWTGILRPVGEPDLPAGPLRAVASRLEVRGDAEAAAFAWRRFGEAHRDDPGIADARLRLGLLLEARPDSRAEAKGLCQEALDLARAARQADVIRSAEAALARLGGEGSPPPPTGSGDPPPTAPPRSDPPAVRLSSSFPQGRADDLQRNVGEWMKAVGAGGPQPPWAVERASRPPDADGGAPEARAPTAVNAAPPGVPDWTVAAVPPAPPVAPPPPTSPEAWLSAAFDSAPGAGGGLGGDAPFGVEDRAAWLEPAGAGGGGAGVVPRSGPPVPVPALPRRSLAVRPVHTVDVAPGRVRVRDSLGQEEWIRAGEAVAIACGLVRSPGGREGEWICDVVVALDDREGRGSVRTVRLSAARTPFHELFGRIAPNDAANFRRLMDQLRSLAPRDGWIPPEAGRFGGSVPEFAGLGEYEAAILAGLPAHS
ncbi:rhomboid family intramembrane serine protease [Myxococcota bacterium]|nr:rhomboid family intramembrane serine protease [Myxococcota bacterium]